MPTYIQRELAGVAPITQPMLTSESKHTLDDKRDEARLHRIEAKELREFNQPIVEPNKNTQLSLRRSKIINFLRNFKKVTVDEALHIPYSYYRYAA